ncbi:MAG: response regulator [Flavobacterium sp.]|nr:response regulator [Flavobacterium sp.]
MFKKILIAEDIDSIGLGLSTILEKLHAAEIVHARYCDDALLKIKKAAQDDMPFELLITDLSFAPDHRQVKLQGGEDLIVAVRTLQPDIKIIVYSVEDRMYKIRRMLDFLHIDGFVWKGREGSGEILKAIDAIFNEGKYLSPRFSHIFNPAAVMEIREADIELIRLLSEGHSQPEISNILKAQNKNSSTSYIEKRISSLKELFKAKNTLHLVSIAKDMGLV